MTVARRALVAGFCGLSASLLVARTAAAAAPLAPPTQKPVLTVSGAIGVKNVGETAVFDMPALESLGLTSFSTSTPWDEGKVTYEGVLLSTLLDRLQANGKTLVAIALNDYAAELPIADFAKYGTLLATKRNGKYMPVSDKGPLFIIYPFDSDPNLKQQTYYGRSAWQVNKLVVK